MISRKIFNADGHNSRFLSDFIIASEQSVRVYIYIYDDTLNPDGSEDVLQSGSTNQDDWSFPDNIWKRGDDIPDSGNDLLTIDKWDLVTNSILTYETPVAPAKIWLEVATTPEEFGGTLVQPSVEIAKEAAIQAAASAAAAAASEVAADISETNAEDSMDSSYAYMMNAGVYEADAEASAIAADVSETNAGISETNAAASATAAGISETNADDYMTEAYVHMLNAGSSASNASNSEAAALISENAASASETNAAASAAAADVSETNAGISEDNAEAAATLAWDAPAIASAFNYRNKLMNGNFDIYQRAITATLGPAPQLNQIYQVSDRWLYSTDIISYVKPYTDGILIQQANNDVVNVASTSIMRQRIEGTELSGKTLNFTGIINIEVDTVFSLELLSYENDILVSTAPAVPVTITTLNQDVLLAITFTVPSLALSTTSRRDYQELRIQHTNVIPASTLKNTIYKQFQIDIGDATPFERLPVSITLDMCKRFTQVVYAADGYRQLTAVTAVGYATSHILPMRDTPILTNNLTYNACTYDTYTYEDGYALNGSLILPPANERSVPTYTAFTIYVNITSDVPFRVFGTLYLSAEF